MDEGAEKSTVHAGTSTWLQLALVNLFGLPLITPLLRWTSVPCTHDGHLHYHRVAAIRHAWENGLYYSRWLPDLAFGYGYPFFLYREPLPLYLTHFLHLAGLPLPAASNLFYILCILAAGWFTFLWVRDVFGAPAGLISAVAYMAAPYQLVDALVRGNQVESLALTLFPLLLWAGRRFLLSGAPRWFLVTTLGLSALSLSHNISLLLFTPTLALYLLALAWLHRQAWGASLLRLVLIFGLGLGLTSFHTGPALLEMDEVTLSLSTTTRNNDFHYNFASLQEIFAPVPPEDPGLINPPLPFRLGWAATLLALFGLLTAFWNRDREQRGHILLMVAGATGFLLFALPASLPLWEALPLIEFVQFPWRFVGRAALPVAMLAGAPLAVLAHQARFRRWMFIAMAGAMALLVLEAFPLLYPNLCREVENPTIATVHQYEHQTGLVGVDPEGSYFPVTVRERPEGSALEADYAAGRTPQRFDRTVLPQSTHIANLRYEPNKARIDLETPVSFQARYLSFAFPGWQVLIDGKPVEIVPEEPLGLITFAVPAGRHTILVEWQQTPLRTAFAAVSALAGVLLVAAIVYSKRQSSTALETQTLNIKIIPSLLVLALLLLGAKLTNDQFETPLRRRAAPPVTHPLQLQAENLQLAGYRLSDQTVAAGETFDIHLAWEVMAQPGDAYQSNVWLQDSEGLIWSDKETFRPRLYEDAPPTQSWGPGQWAWDSREVQVLPGTPPGRYDIVLTTFRLADLQPLTLHRNGTPVGPSTVIGQVEVGQPATSAHFQPQYPLQETVAGLSLLGYNQDRAAAAPGDPFLLTLFWEKPAGRNVQAADLSLSLKNRAGKRVKEWQIPAVRTDYPPSEWTDGARLRGQHLLRLPAALETDDYHFWLGDVALGQIAVDAPQRRFEEPSFQHAVGATFGEKVHLVGYSLSPADALASPNKGPMSVTLIWQGLTETTVSFRVFVHLVDEHGHILAQSDAEPVNWSRPTTGWAPGEYLIDEHQLNPAPEAPPERLFLRVGLYDPRSGARLEAEGAEFVLLRP